MSLTAAEEAVVNARVQASLASNPDVQRAFARLAAMTDASARITCEPVRTQPLNASDIPADMTRPAAGTVPFLGHGRPFVHKPTITLYRDGRPQNVRGPVEPLVLGRDDAERQRYADWQDQSAKADEQRAAEARARVSRLKNYFDTRARKKLEKDEDKYRRACDRAARQGKPAPERPEPKPVPKDWLDFCRDKELYDNVMAARRSSSNKKRLQRYDHHRGLAAGRRTESFKEEFDKAVDGGFTKALRTALGIHSFQILNSSLPQTAFVIYGHDKTTVYDNSDSTRAMLGGLQVRDMEYVESDRARRTLFVVDLDGWWPSVEALWNALRGLLPPEFMPNLISYRGSIGRGGVENPHLLFLLPPIARVISYAAQSSESFLRQRNLHSMIQKGIVSHLIPLGADPDHHNVWKFKNALTPKWSVVACDDHFASMEEWRAFLPTITPDTREMKRRAKVVKAAREGKDPNDVTLSGAIFADGVSSRRLLIRAAYATRDPDFTKAVNTSHAAFVAWMYHPVTGVVTRRLHALHPESHDAVVSILRAQREWVVELQMTPDQCSQYADRGRFADELKKLVPPCAAGATKADRELREKAMKRAGASLGRQAVRDLHCGLLAEEVERRLATGLSIAEVSEAKADVVKAVVAAGTVARSTAYRLIDEVILTVSQAARYQASDLDIEKEQPSSDPAEPVETIEATDNVDPESPSETRSTVATDFRNRSAVEKRASVEARLRKSHLTRLRWKQAVERSRRQSISDVESVDSLIDVDLSSLDPDDWMVSLLRSLAEQTTYRRPTVH